MCLKAKLIFFFPLYFFLNLLGTFSYLESTEKERHSIPLSINSDADITHSHENDKDQDDSLLDDPLIIEVPVRINRFTKGSTEIKIQEDGSVLIYSSPVKKTIAINLNEEACEECLELFPKELELIEPFDGPNGFSLQYNESDQLVEVLIPLTFIKTKISSLCNRRTPDIEEENIVLPAEFSCYANFFLDKTFTYLRDSHFCREHTPAAFICDYCFHRGLWTLEGDFDFGSDYYKEQLWSNVLLTRDVPEKNLRLGFGNIEPLVLGAQIGIPLMGISVDKDSYYFTDICNRPSGDMSFFLNSPSLVEIRVNGNFYKIIKLPPGPHKLEDFPPIPGNNVVTLKIIDTDENIQLIDFPYSFSPNQVRDGLFAYSYGIGFPESWDCNSYLWELPCFTISGIYGLSNEVSKGAYFQVSPDNLQLGSEIIWINTSYRMKSGWGLSWYFPVRPNLQWYFSCDNSTSQNSFIRWNVNLEFLGKPLLYRLGGSISKDYYCFNNELPQAFASYNISKELSNAYFLSLGASCAANQNWKTEFALNASLSKNFNQSISASISGYTTINSFYKNTSCLTFNIAAAIPNTSIFNSSTYISERKTFYNQTSYRKKFESNNILNTTVGFENSERQNTVCGNAFFTNNFLTSSTMVNATKTKSVRDDNAAYNGFANLSLGTCLLYADSCFAISRPNYDSFVIIKPRYDLSPYGVTVNNTYSSIGALPIVLDNVSSYDNICINAISDNLPVGYNFGQTSFCCKTEYKSGTVIRVGKGKCYLLIGKIVDNNEAPVKLAFGFMKNTTLQEEEFEFFTNRDGDFQVDGVKEGHHQLRIIGMDEIIEFDVYENEEGIIDLNCLILGE